MHYLQHLPESQTVAGDNFEKFHFFVFLGKHLLLTIFKTRTLGVVVLA